MRKEVLIQCRDCGCQAPEEKWDYPVNAELASYAEGFLRYASAPAEVVRAAHLAMRNQSLVKELGRMLQEEREKSSVLEKAVVDWWTEGRPTGWSRRMHQLEPAVNTTTEAEERLARAAAKMKGEL